MLASFGISETEANLRNKISSGKLHRGILDPMLGRHGRVIVAVEGLVVVAALAGQAVSQPASQALGDKPSQEQRQPEQSRRAQPIQTEPSTVRCEGAKPGEDAQLCLDRRSVEAAERQAEEAISAGALAAGNFWLGIIQAFATVLSVFFTGWAAISAGKAARSAQAAADAIPVLERAYIYSELVNSTVASAIEGALHARMALSAEPTVLLRFKNFGKTPASLSHGEVFFSYTGPGPSFSADDQRGWPSEYRRVLSSGEPTECVWWKLGDELTRGQAEALKNGSATLRVWGWVLYLDVWGKEHQADIGWTYARTLGRMVPDDPRRAKQRRKGWSKRERGRALLARLHPSHWWNLPKR